MRLLNMLVVLLATAPVALAQTNSVVSTNVDEVTARAAANISGQPKIRRITLQEAIELALAHNLELQIERYSPQIAQFNLQGAYGSYDPTLNLVGEHDHNEAGSRLLGGGFSIPGSTSDADIFSGSLSGLAPWGTTYFLQGNATDTSGRSFTVNSNGVIVPDPFENSIASTSIRLSQPLLKNLWIDQSRLNIRVAKNRLKYSELGLRLRIMQVVTRLEQAYFELIYSRENVVVLQKAVELAERLVAENRKRLEVGALAPLDLQSAEAQAASTRAAVIQAQSVLGTQERVVKALITDNYRAEFAETTLVPEGTLTAPPPIMNLQDSWEKGLTQRPDILQAKLDIERQGIQLKFDYNQLFPELDVFGSFGYNGSGKEFSDALGDVATTDRPFYTIGGSLNMPLARTSSRNVYRADKAVKEQLILTLKQLEHTIMILIDNDIGTIRSAYNQVQATRAAREFEEAALDAEQKKLESGKSTTYTVLQVQRDLTTARGNEIQALDNYNKSLSQLSLDEASTLDRLHINLEVK